MSFLGDDFLLHSPAARTLYHDHAVRQPIVDFHNHLSPRDIAVDRRFDNLFEIWLEGDHYKWRAMRSAGVAEQYCTGPSPAYEKFLAWAATVPKCLRNPLYHWTHLELRRYFDIEELLDASTAARIWEQANQQLRDGPLTTRGILRRFDVRQLYTTDDPADSLEHHAALRAANETPRVLPTFRPDGALQVDSPARLQEWVERLASVADVHITSVRTLMDALTTRHDDFHAMGGRLSDHGLPYCFASPCSEHQADVIFQQALRNEPATPEQHAQFASFMMLFFGHLDARRGWTKQLHLGARRNINTRMAATIGKDTGYDSIGDWPQVEALATYLDSLDRENALPKVIVYNSNPSDNHAFATMIGNFQDGATPGRIQMGSAWWFLDQKNGIEAQLDALSDAGLLSTFVGMVTDSRSFMSLPRHEYFRRVLCNLLGQEMDRGELPCDFELIGGLVEAVCYGNAYARFCDRRGGS
jgi:glucuronate isomerase